MSADAINYIKKPTEDFLRDSWRLVKRCTKPDRNGAPAQSAAPTHGHTARVGATRCAPRVGATLGAPRDAPPRRHAAVQRVCGRGRVAPRRSRPLRRHLPITASPSPLTVRSPPLRIRSAEFSKIAQATSVGFFIMGFIGFFVKLIFIPINNIIVGMG